MKELDELTFKFPSFSVAVCFKRLPHAPTAHQFMLSCISFVCWQIPQGDSFLCIRHCLPKPREYTATGLMQQGFVTK